ncbi:MAG: hypothetical protein F6K63_11025 [Moorea sp. SIO1G6]|uniref:hypothetical protein n=1 Tax=Moorena sp. SIO1G6 TaxID=2607840 RepID=UPI0013C0FF15|nr:hypothetical protein [Moorena sp. SIO1G6]NET64886.1 hypothetical protein [Moorena sp. SIO1G6]
MLGGLGVIWSRFGNQADHLLKAIACDRFQGICSQVAMVSSNRFLLMLPVGCVTEAS